MKKITFWTGLVLWCLGPVSGQQPYFRYHKLPEDWTDAEVSTIYEASGGFVWIGTDQGLLRFDGLDFKPFRVAGNPNPLEVSAIYADRLGTLWVGYESGTIVHMHGDDSLRVWSPEEGLPDVPITGFGEDEKGRLWFGTYGEGVYFYDGTRMYNFNMDDGLPAEDIYTLVAGPDGRMLIGSDSGLSICWMEGGRKQIKNLTKADGLPDDIIKAILPADDGHIWAGGFDGGICRISLKDFSVQKPETAWKNGVINNLLIFDGLELWIGTEGNGIWRYNFDEKRYSAVESFRFGKARIQDLLKDVEGNVWVASNEVPLASANRQFEFLHDGLKDIQAVLYDKDHQLWVGAQTGLYKYETQADGGKTFLEVIPGINVISLHDNDSGVLWIGCFGEGLYAYQKSTGATRIFTESDGLSNGSILSIADDGDKLWLATLGGVSSIKAGTNPFGDRIVFKKEEDLGANFVFKVYCDSKGRKWFGTDGKGLVMMDKGRIANYDSTGAQAFKSVYAVTEDESGRIWFSTAKEGLFSFDGSVFGHFGLQEGLRSLTINGLATDGKGQVLVIHPNGIDLLNPELKHFIYFDREVGLTDFEPNLNAIYADKEGRVWIGAKEGVIGFNPLKEALSIHPRIMIDRVSVFLEPIDFNRVNSFPHDRNGLAIDYSGIWLTDPETVKFRYKLEGFDREWIISADRRVVYSNLPPGDYKFVISASENGKFQSEPIATYSFLIRTPYWKKNWFIGASVLLGVLLVYYIIQIREKRLQRVEALKKEKVESQYETLKSQINPHFLFNNFNTLVAIIEESPELAVEYVEKLSDFYRHILQYREKDLIDLQEELGLVMDYGFLLEKRFGDGLQLKTEEIPQEACIAPLALQMLVENAVKHNVISKSRPLKIRIYPDDHGYIVVCNNLQKKLSPEKSTGFGLQSIAKRYEHLSQKNIRVEESADSFKVFIPLIKKEPA